MLVIGDIPESQVKIVVAGNYLARFGEDLVSLDN
jgi:hypothetical protein